jgi:YegS/Rv2252/BmrU family lipid kinase
MLNFIVNTKSGKGAGFTALKKVIGYCHANDVAYAAHITSRAGHATVLAEQLCSQGAETIVAIGGDGTFHEVLNGVTLTDNFTLGFIPAGLGNDYARAAGLSKDPVRALKAVLRGERVRTDYIRVGGKRCLNVAGTGLDVEVLKHADGDTGRIAYIISLLHCLKCFAPYKLTITANGETADHEVMMIGVCNGSYIGGGMKISPFSDINDGKLNVVAVHVPADGKIMKALPKFLKGKHIDKEYTSHFLCESVKIVPADPLTIQLDGELYTNLDFDCNIETGKLWTFKPV